MSDTQNNQQTNQPTNQHTNQQTNFQTWLTEQDEATQTMFNNHIAGLKSALETERSDRKKLEKEVRDAAKKLEQGSETQQQLEKMANDLATTSSRAAFYETAHSAGVKNLPLAYVAARESGLLTDDGTADMKGIKERFPELFTSTAPPPGNAGEGTQTPPPNSEPDMDTFIRRAAGR